LNARYPVYVTSRQVQLAKRPRGQAREDDFDIVDVQLGPPAAGEVLVENRFLSVDPYMRPRMDDRPSYFAPWPLRGALDGDAVGVVVESRDRSVAAGDWVVSERGWRDRFVAPAGELRPLAMPPAGLDHGAYLGVMGATGLTAYLGVEDVLRPAPGDCVFVSTAAGAVGSVAGQLCRLRGARVIGSTSTDEKVALVTRRYGFAAAFEYRRTDPRRALAELAPDGIDGFFDNVGGEQFEAALDAMRVGGRIAKCGGIGAYDGSPVPGPPNLDHFFGKRLTMVGFLVSDHRARVPVFQARMRGWLDAREVVADDTRVEGLETAVTAFLGLFSGSNVGKSITVL
jgi:NADPH-dependent curcumin reductase CurA